MMSRHCSSVKSVGYDLSFITPLPQNLTPTRRVNNSPDQMSRDNNCLKFSKPCNGHALILFRKYEIISVLSFSPTFLPIESRWSSSRPWHNTTMGSRSDAEAWRGSANRAGELR